MKTFKGILPFLLFMALFTGNTNIVIAQKKVSAKETEIKNLLYSQQYIFYAQSVIPSSGRQRFLTSEYTVTISKDTIVSYLPYFGRAYSATLGTTDGGIKFTSVDFDYTISDRKKGGWEINIHPKGGQDVQKLNFTVYNNGTAYLFVNSNNRQSISFNGYVRARKK
jgi:hypothetical protein